MVQLSIWIGKVDDRAGEGQAAGVYDFATGALIRIDWKSII